MARSTNITRAQRSSGIALRIVLALGVAASLVAGLTACSSNAAPSTVSSSVESPTSSAASGLPVSSYAALNQNGGPFSAQVLSSLSPAELTALFQIKASDIPSMTNGKMPKDAAAVAKFGQEYAKVFAQRIEAWNNAGCTLPEWSPYASQANGTFEAAMTTKYNKPIAMGVFAYDTVPKAHLANMDRCSSMFMDNKSLYNRIDVVDGSVEATAHGDGSISITVVNRYTDNFDLRDALGANPVYAPSDYTLSWGLIGLTNTANGLIFPNNVTTVVISATPSASTRFASTRGSAETRSSAPSTWR